MPLPLTPIEAVLNILYETFKLLHKDEAEKFEKEWKNDSQEFLRALEEGDVETLNRLLTKYRNPLV